MNRLVVSLFSVAAVSSALGCSNADTSTTSGTTGGTGGGGPDLSGVVFQGDATASELTALLAAKTSTKEKPMPGFTNPPPTSEYLAKDPAPKFTWAAKGDAPAGARELVYLQFGAPGQAELLRVFTSEASFQPTDAQWKSVSLGTWVTVDIFGGSFVRGALEGDAAEGDPVQFCSMPPAK